VVNCNPLAVGYGGNPGLTIVGTWVGNRPSSGEFEGSRNPRSTYFGLPRLEGDGYLVLAASTNGGFTAHPANSNVCLSSSGGGLFGRPNSQESGRFLILGVLFRRIHFGYSG